MVTFDVCNGTGCKPLNEIEAFLTGKEFKLPVIDTFLNPFSDSILIDEISEINFPFISYLGL